MSPDVFHPDKGGEPSEVEILYLPALPASVPLARRMATSCLSKWDLDDLVFPCAQVVTELAANSVAETGPQEIAGATSHDRVPEVFAVHLYRTIAHLIVKVSDASPEPPRPRTAAEQDENGRGLALVEALADHGGWYPGDPEGKVVYVAWDLPAVSAEAMR